MNSHPPCVVPRGTDPRLQPFLAARSVDVVEAELTRVLEWVHPLIVRVVRHRCRQVEGPEWEDAVSEARYEILVSLQRRRQDGGVSPATLGEYARHLMLARGNVVDAAFALYLLGAIDGSRGDNQAALKKCTEAQRIFEAADDKDKLARALAGEGVVRLQLGGFREALAQTRRALGIYREIHGKEGTINALNTSGSIFLAQGLTDRALDYRQQALAVAGDDPGWQVYLCHNIANVYSKRGERDKAIEWMSRSIAAADKVGDRPRFAAGLQELGGLHLQNGQFNLAEDELRRALAIGVETGDKRRQAGALSGLANLLRQRGDEKSRHEALAAAERAAVLAHETGEPDLIRQSNTFLGQLLLSVHEPDRAREAFEESISAIEDTRGHPAKARPTSAGARRGRHRALERRGLAAPAKKAREEKAHLVLIDESGFFLNPLVLRTWAPKGQDARAAFLGPAPRQGPGHHGPERGTHLAAAGPLLAG